MNIGCRGFLFWIPFLLAGCGTSDSPPADVGLIDLRDGPPHVVILALDTFRADHVGTLGNKWISTPTLDAFAREAIVFEDCASNSTWTLPSFASMFTGLLPSEHRTIGGRRARLPSDIVPLAERLKIQGFETTAFVAVDFLDDPFGLNRGFDRHLNYSEWPVNGRLRKPMRTIRKAIEKPRAMPWFLLVHYFDAHDPYEPPDEFDRMYYEGDPEVVPEAPERRIDVIYSGQNRIAVDPERRYGWLSGVNDLQYPVRQYAGGISYVDHYLQDVLDHLRESGLLDESIVVIVGDHGEHLTEHDVYFSHRLPYAECLQVPLMIRLPHAKQGGRRVTTPVSLVDVMPTIMDLIGAPVEDDCTGMALSGLMRGEELRPRLLFAEYGAQTTRWAKSVWDKDWRYTEIRLDSLLTAELFDRSADPREEVNLASERPDLVELYSGALDLRFGPERRLVLERGSEPEPVELPLGVEERLRALGYVGGSGN